MISLLSGDNRSVGHQREVDPGVGHQVGLELSQINVKSAVKSQGGGDGGYDLSHQSVQVGVGGTFDVEVAAADVVDSLVVDHEGTVGVLKGGVCGKDGVIRLDNGGGDLRGGVDSELQFALLTVVHTQSLQEERCESRPSTSTEGVEDEESLKSGTLVSKFPDSVQAKIDDLLSNSVVSSSVVVGSVLLASDELFRVEELSVGSSPHFVNYSRLQVQEHSSRDVFSSSSLAEEGVEGIITTSNSLVRGHLSIRLDTVLETVEFPTCITDLYSSLSKVY